MNVTQRGLARFCLCIVCVVVGLASSGCKHTANGAGQDIEKMGEKIQEKTQ